MEKCVFKLLDYFEKYKEELKGKFIQFDLDCKNGKITQEEYVYARGKIHYCNQIASHIAIFFNDSCGDVFGYYNELSHHLEDPTFTDKDVFLILRHTIFKCHNNFFDTDDNLPCLERIQDFSFKSITHAHVAALIQSGRINELIAGDAKNVTLPELGFLKEYNENFDKFTVSMKPLRDRVTKAHLLFDKIETLEDIDNLESSLRDLDITDVCLNRLRNHLEHRVNRKLEKENKRSEQVFSSDSPKYLKSNSSVQILTEKDVRELKKEIKKIFDMYHRVIVRMPSYSELIHTLECLRALDELESMSISLFIRDVIDYYISRGEMLVHSYDEMIYLASIMYYYKTDEKYISDFFRYTSHNLVSTYDNFFVEYESKREKIEFLDEGTYKVLEDLMDVLVEGDTDSKNFVVLSIMDELDALNNGDDYSYELKKAKSKRKEWYHENSR